MAQIGSYLRFFDETVQELAKCPVANTPKGVRINPESAEPLLSKQAFGLFVVEASLGPKQKLSDQPWLKNIHGCFFFLGSTAPVNIVSRSGAGDKSLFTLGDSKEACDIPLDFDAFDLVVPEIEPAGGVNLTLLVFAVSSAFQLTHKHRIGRYFQFGSDVHLLTGPTPWTLKNVTAELDPSKKLVEWDHVKDITLVLPVECPAHQPVIATYEKPTVISAIKHVDGHRFASTINDVLEDLGKANDLEMEKVGLDQILVTRQPGVGVDKIYKYTIDCKALADEHDAFVCAEIEFEVGPMTTSLPVCVNAHSLIALKTDRLARLVWDPVDLVDDYFSKKFTSKLLNNRSKLVKLRPSDIQAELEETMSCKPPTASGIAWRDYVYPLAHAWLLRGVALLDPPNTSIEVVDSNPSRALSSPVNVKLWCLFVPRRFIDNMQNVLSGNADRSSDDEADQKTAASGVQ